MMCTSMLNDHLSKLFVAACDVFPYAQKLEEASQRNRIHVSACVACKRYSTKCPTYIACKHAVLWRTDTDFTVCFKNVSLLEWNNSVGIWYALTITFLQTTPSKSTQGYQQNDIINRSLATWFSHHATWFR